jgi:hypothetical protein
MVNKSIAATMNLNAKDIVGRFADLPDDQRQGIVAGAWGVGL